MKVIDAGHSYELAGGNGLVFRQMQDGRIVRDGTTNEEVLHVLIERVTEDYRTQPCRESIRALYLLREALATLRMRSARSAIANIDGIDPPHTLIVEEGESAPLRIGSRDPDMRPPFATARTALTPAALAALAVCLRHRRDRNLPAPPRPPN